MVNKNSKDKKETKVREITLWLRKGTVEATGRLYYDNTVGAWTMIRLKKEIICQLPRLKERRTEFSYKMVTYENRKELLNAINGVKEGEEPMPVLLYFNEVKKD